MRSFASRVTCPQNLPIFLQPIPQHRTACLLDSDGRVTAYGQRIAALLPLRPSLGRLVLCGALLRVVLPAVAMAVSWMAQV